MLLRLAVATMTLSLLAPLAGCSKSADEPAAENAALATPVPPGMIRGTVLDANNNPVPASQVLLRWVHETNGIKTQATRRASADSYGISLRGR